jgi:hypothetical protein
VRAPFDYAIVRVVPRVEREEFVNAGVIVHAPTLGFLGCALALDRHRVLALAEKVDLEALTRHLDAFRAVCYGDHGAGSIAALPISERFHWLVAPRSTIIQTSAVHGGVCSDPTFALRDLFKKRVA